MLFTKPIPPLEPLRTTINHAYRMDETQCVEQLLQAASLPPDALSRITTNAKELVAKVRQTRLSHGGFDAFLCEYDLSNSEGLALMCLAEALLRIPDTTTADKLLRDKIIDANWLDHVGQSDSFFVNAATWGLLLTGKLFSNQDTEEKSLRNSLKRFIGRSATPLIRQSARKAMQLLGHQFVMGETIAAALKRAREGEKRGYLYSFDMLGEAARTTQDAQRYFQAYSAAIQAVATAADNRGIHQSPGISVKLSALHPRYELAQHEAVMRDLVPRLRALVLQTKEANIGLTIDPEEAERLDISLDVFSAVLSDPALNGWQGFGIGVQTYQKRALPQIDWLAALARKHQRRLLIRLLKGAYWDAEIKISQVKGLEGYPVFTRKATTDVAYIACAKKILAAPDAFYPQFATHNAYTVATILELIGDRKDFEFQCLYGMGYSLYDQLIDTKGKEIRCRVYAPVGSYEELLAYLVRRLLENGANSSFVNQILDENTPIESLVEDPVAKVRTLSTKPHPLIPLPVDLYGTERKNSLSIDLTNWQRLNELDHALEHYIQQTWTAAPLVNGEKMTGEQRMLYSPSDKRQVIGTVIASDAAMVDKALNIGTRAYVNWELTGVDKRASCLERAAELLEQRMPQFMALAIREAGKTVADALNEVREAIDFCRYYAQQARKLFQPHDLAGPTGEANQLSLHARGVIVCISPWNFPLAIFMGQITAALATGNAVIAKPAEQTPLIAAAAVELLHEAGVPQAVLQLLPGRGSVIGAQLVGDWRTQGVIFTGSTETARLINQTLANRQGPIVPLIAETGGQNAMIVDSSALPEQVVADVITSAFGSAGQRCSALRVLFIQEDIAPKLLDMLCGAMAELRLGDPGLLSTDIGPVIDDSAQKMLQQHSIHMQQQAKLLYQCQLPADTAQGSFFAPTLFELERLSQLTHEVFGPILHVIRYSAKELDQVILAINQTGYGLTLGIQSRIDTTIDYIRQRVRVGNIYVNRTMIGAVVGVQPFGGEGLSGTGPKAGGPHYLTRLCTERALCVNTTAAGGNASLLMLTGRVE